MSERSEKGQRAENAAAEYLGATGFEIVEQRYRRPGGEIDIICSKGDTLHFVEVRFRQSERYGSPAETVGVRKQQLLMRCALGYIAEKGTEYEKFSMDIMEVTGTTDLKCNFIENAFC